MEPSTNSPAQIEARYRGLFIVWLAILSTVFVFFVLTLLMPRQTQADSPSLVWILCAVGTFVAVISFVPKQQMLRQAEAQQQPRLVTTGYIVAFALSEMAGLVGMLLYLLTQGQAYLLMFFISAFFMFLHFPRKQHLAAASFRKQ
ncbi:MAG: hypothetical protein JO360_01940 [Acidobacteria bacterium]|nr:hypothetical protein [Acidobacteriota bacterium]